SGALLQLNADGTSGEFNDVSCGNIEKKLGLHASPTTVLNFGNNNDCIGYLCGKENSGLAHMFQMMNAARINTGVSGMTLGSTAYRNALEYTKNRVQGRDIAGRQKGDVPIIDHPDIRRNLLWMKAAVDGMRSMIYTAALRADLAAQLPEGEEKTHHMNLVDFLTPIIKAHCSDMGFRVCETAIQCLGGYGFCKDFPLEQYLRDAKIMSLYEGTNGIQAMDLLGRKMTLRNGASFMAFKNEIKGFCDKNREHPELGDKVRALEGVAKSLWETAGELQKKKETDPLQWASYTYPAFTAFADITMSWVLLDMAIISYPHTEKKGKKNDFYRGKVLQATYFVDTTLPHTQATLEICQRNSREIVIVQDNAF
ncbi:MAG: acyl-CoA dehydrogenase, partial [Desulfobacterium sp.]